MTTNPASFGEMYSGLSTIIPGIWPVFLLQEQVDQGNGLNGKLLAASRRRRLRIVGITYSAPARMPAGRPR
jgi:hypothetical protein